MSLDLSNLDIEDVIAKITLTKPFEFETRQSLDECIHQLRLLQPNHDWDVHFGGPRTVHEVIISQFDDDSCYYDVSTKYRSRQGRGYSRTANVSGKMKLNPATGGTIVSGEAKMNLVSVALALVVAVVFMGMILFSGFPAMFLLFAAGAIGYMVYSMYIDYSNLLQRVHELA